MNTDKNLSQEELEKKIEDTNEYLRSLLKIKYERDIERLAVKLGVRLGKTVVLVTNHKNTTPYLIAPMRSEIMKDQFTVFDLNRDTPRLLALMITVSGEISNKYCYIDEFVNYTIDTDINLTTVTKMIWR